MDESEFPPDDDDVLQETFKRAADFVTFNTANMKDDDLLYLYGRYKQSLCGPCKEPMPGILKFRHRSKWSAWNAVGDIAREDAMQQYIDKISQLNPDWDTSKPKEGSEKKHFGPVNSSCLNTDPELKEESKTIFDYVKEGNLDKVQKLILCDSALKCAVDDDGLSLMHWACDRGHSNVVNLLISQKVDVNKQDNDGQTPLHYASSCGHEDVANILLKAGANVDVFDTDGLSPADVAYNISMKDLLTLSSK